MGLSKAYKYPYLLFDNSMLVALLTLPSSIYVHNLNLKTQIRLHIYKSCDGNWGLLPSKVLSYIFMLLI